MRAKHLRSGLWLLLATTSLAFADEPKTTPPKLLSELRKPGDTFVARTEAHRTVYVITSPSGIGDAKITRAEGEWPRHVALRLQYEQGRPFTMLEAFSFRTDRLEVNSALGRIPEKAQREPVPVKLNFWFVSSAGEPKFQYTGRIPAAGTLDATVQVNDGSLEIVLPADCLTESKTLRLDWIDAFRL